LIIFINIRLFYLFKEFFVGVIELEIELHDFIDLTYDMIFVIDKGGFIKFANLAAEENLFYTREEFLHMNLNEILFESEKMLEILEKIISIADKNEGQNLSGNQQVDISDIKKGIANQDLILISKDVNLKIIMANFQARKMVVDDVEYFLLILRDITDRKSLEQELFKITENLENIVYEKTLELQKKNEMLERLATTDTMTNLLNIRRFREILKAEIEKSSRMENDPDYDTFVVVMFDADHFKYYNDTFGHQVGDDVIKGVASILASSVRKIDIAARYGGDEFILILLETDYLAALRTCFRIREKVRNELNENIKKSIKEFLGIENVEIPPEHKISISMGVSKYQFGKNMDDIINEADTGIYRSKEAGRDCIHVLRGDDYKYVKEDIFNPDDYK